MTLACTYAIARFLPYAETEEFANFGIVLHCRDAGFFGFKLLTRQFARITGFFGELEPAVYRSTRESLEAELLRIRDRIAAMAGGGDALFQELIRPREAIVRFSEARVVMTRDPQAEVDRLFGHYVKRNFATPEYQDRVANKAVRRILKQAGIEKDFARETIAAGGYHAAFPFVRREGNHVRQVIKPLYLAHKDGARIFDHGWQWVGRIRRLHELDLHPDQILVPVRRPKTGETELYAQYDAARRELENVNAEVVPIEDAAAVKRLVLSRFKPGIGGDLRLV